MPVGLVGASEIGYHAEVILAGRRINDGMGSHVAGQVVKLMLWKGCTADYWRPH